MKMPVRCPPGWRPRGVPPGAGPPAGQLASHEARGLHRPAARAVGQE